MHKSLTALVLLFFIPFAQADELTSIIQKDLTALGYETGNVDGELTMETVVAISKFQAENNLDVSGEPSPQLAGIIKSKASPRLAAGSNAPAQPDPAALQAAQQACLQEKIAAAQASQKKKRGFGSLMSAIGRTAAQVGGIDMSNEIAKVSNDIYQADATAKDLKRAAKDLGLSQDDVEACRNPSM